MDILVWAIICVFCLIAEAITVGDLITIWFALGALFACIVSIFTESVTVEVVVFVVVSFISLLSLRPIIVKVLKGDKKANINSMVGMEIKLLSPITPDDPGTTKIDGVVWRAVSADDKPIEAYTYCEIVQVEGNKLIVKSKNK